MKKVWLTLIAVMAFASAANAEMKCEAGKCGSAMMKDMSKEMPKKMPKMFQSVSEGEATLLQQGANKAACPLCNMNLPKFFKTNHAATVDGQVKQYCSIHCLADEIAMGHKVSDVKVVDVNSLKFIDVAQATYVVGSDVKGTMTMSSKYAFASKKRAEMFAQEHGGTLMTYEEALKAATDDMAKDKAMIAEKKKKMMQH